MHQIKFLLFLIKWTQIMQKTAFAHDRKHLISPFQGNSGSESSHCWFEI